MQAKPTISAECDDAFDQDLEEAIENTPPHRSAGVIPTYYPYRVPHEGEGVMVPALYITRKFEKQGIQCHIVCPALMFLKTTYKAKSNLLFKVSDEMVGFVARKDRVLSDTLYGALTKPVKRFARLFGRSTTSGTFERRLHCAILRELCSTLSRATTAFLGSRST